VAEQAFLEILRKIESQGRSVSPKPGPNYAPKVFAAHPDTKGITSRMFALAMERLLDHPARIKVVPVGSESRRTHKLATV
jgi:hypothetical protein